MYMLLGCNWCCNQSMSWSNSLDPAPTNKNYGYHPYAPYILSILYIIIIMILYMIYIRGQVKVSLHEPLSC